MARVSWTLILCGSFAVSLGSAGDASGQGPSGRVAPRFSVRWIGQDGHDYVSSSDRHEPDERQDVHLALNGLDPKREIRFIEISVPGGHRWQYNPLPGYWHAHLVRRDRAPVGDLWVQTVNMPAGTVYHVLVRYEDNTTVEADVRSRQVDQDLRVAAATVQARWIGQGGQDLTGVGTGVGPDGLQDARIHLSNLSPRFPVKSVRLETSGGLRWEAGVNSQAFNNAEFLKDPKDPHQGDLFFQPEHNLAGQRLRLGVTYEGSVPDSIVFAAGRCDPRLRMPQSQLPRTEEFSIASRWLGQDGTNPARPGDIHVILKGLPGSGRIVAMAVTDTVRGAWQYRASDRAPSLLDGTPGSLEVRFQPDRKTADLYLTPYRETSRETFSVRLLGADGRTWHGRFSGGPSELARLAPQPDPSRAEARPGDDLQALLDHNGTVVLTSGIYRLRHPLVLNRPSRLTSSGRPTLLFAQDASDPPWKTAIKVRCSNTSLEGFAVRFEGPIRWDGSVSYGPAVIGMTENSEAGFNELKTEVLFRDLDLESPPADDPSKWTDSIRLFRLVGAASGAIVHNRLRGGPIEFFHGPWRIVDNDFRGTPPGTSSQGVLTGHFTHDLLIRGNQLSSPRPSGKTWRFLVLTGSSINDRVEKNRVEGVGARDDDTIPWCNAPEIILTENYWLKYEGKVLARSDDGRVVRIGRPQGPAIQPGDVVAILDGPAAGRWRRVAHVLDPTACLLDEPLPRGSEIVSISQAFVSEVFEDNRIDIRGGRRSDGFVLAGNHYGARVAGNHLLGGGSAWRMLACPTEGPVTWGWSHTPFFGAVVEKNVLEDGERGGEMGVEHSVAIKANKGRSYMSIHLRNNVVRWSDSYLEARRRTGIKEPLSGLILGYQPSLDPSELVVDASGNTLDAPSAYRDAPAMVVHGARLNSQKVVDRKYRLPAVGGSSDVGRREASSGGSRPVR